MSRIYGYIRVSTSKQDYENQKFGILEYANKNNFSDIVFIDEIITSKKSLEQRKIWELIQDCGEHDTIITTELSRFGRSLTEVMYLFKILTEKNIVTHIIKNNIILNQEANKLTNSVLIFAFGLAAEIERDLISSRTKEALAKRKAEGQVLGRIAGSTGKSKLDEHRNDLIKFLVKDINLVAIAKIFGCSRTAVVHYIKTRNLKKEVEKIKAKQKEKVL